MTCINYLAALAAVLALCTGTGAGADELLDCSAALGHITVTGKGKIEAEPDLARLSFTVTENAQEAVSARNAAEEKISSFLEALIQHGIPREKIAAGSITVLPQYTADRNGSRVQNGYQAVRAVVIELEDFSLISLAGDLAMESGINGIGGFEYLIRNEKELKLQADAEAIADAKDQALRLAEGFGVKLSKPCSLSFGTSSRPVLRYRAGSPRNLQTRAASLPAEGESAAYMPEKLTVESIVEAQFAIE